MSKPMTKGSFQYIKRKKERQCIYTLILFAIAIAIFVLGLCLNQFNKSNIFTVFSILMVLPSVKMLISFIILVPYHSVSKECYDEVKANTPDGVTVFTDVVFTSYEKVMNVDFLLVDKNCIVVYTPHKDKLTYINKYLSEGMTKRDYPYKVESYSDYHQFLARIQKLSFSEESKGASYDDMLEYITSLFV